MNNLSRFLTEHIKANIFNAGKFRDGETFDTALERVIHEGIFLYRKRIMDGNEIHEHTGCIATDSIEILISAALLQVEKDNPFAWVKQTGEQN